MKNCVPGGGAEVASAPAEREPRKDRFKDLVVAGALIAAVLHGGFLVLRARGMLGAHWTDGRQRFASETGELVRHAVWDAPEVLVGLGDGARDPALAPDGRFLVFAAGERRLNAELYVSEIVDGVPSPAEPLRALNSPADEVAPAFANGALWFASDRPGGVGGLDLWRASYSDGQFGPCEPIAPGLNSSADDTDPAPLASGALVFASDRRRPGRDLDLFQADIAGEVFDVASLDALNTEFQEREPCVGSDDLALYFASDRSSEGGDLQLLRSLRAHERWLPPAPLLGLDGPGEERAPCVSTDGFTLLFERREPGAAPEILRARSRELYFVPASPAGLADWLFLVGLVLLAALALLAKRWHALNVYYKCLLASLVAHVLLLFYLRVVYPQGPTLGGTGGGGESDASFQIHIAPSRGDGGAPSGLEAHLGGGVPRGIERERFSPGSGGTGPSGPVAAQLSAPERTADAAPAPERLSTSGSPGSPGSLDEAAAVALQEREARAPRQGGAAPGLAMDAGSAGGRSGGIAVQSPERGELAHGGTPGGMPGVARPGASALTTSDAASSDIESGGPAPASPARGGTGTALAVAEVAGPAERFEPKGGGARSLEIGGLAYEAPAIAIGSAPARRDVGGGNGAGSPSGTSAAVPGPAGLAAVDTGAPAAPGRSAPAVGSATAGLGSTLGDTGVRAPARESAPSGSGASASPFDAIAGLGAVGGGLDNGGSTARSTSTGTTGPERGVVAGPLGDGAGSPASPTIAALALPGTSEDVGATPAPGRASPSAPAGLASASSSRTEVRAPEGPAAADSTAKPGATASATFDALGGLGGLGAAPARSSAETATARAPERQRLGPSAPTLAARPETRPIDEPRVEEAAFPVEDTPRTRINGTPYQNRFGAPKLRALEEFGGSEKTERAVALGLAYLKSIQGDDGAWGDRSDAHEKYLDVRIGKTGLALLAFLGAGHVPEGSTEHEAVAARAVQFLLGVQDEDTGHMGRSCSYGHGIATYALAECYALTHDERLRAPLERAVAEILRNQRTERDPRRHGGWTYYFGDGHVWNGDEWPRTSITAWQVMALESARLGGIEVPDPTFEAAREFLTNAWDARAGAFRYAHDPQRLNSGYPILPASTPAALFALGLLGVDPASSELGSARRFVLARLPDGYRYTGNDDFVEHGRGNLYFWYYATLAMFRVGGSPWERWNEALKATLLPAQEPDGSWPPIDIYAEYAGDDDEERTYTTAMCVLSLEIYYRYFTPLLRVR